MMASAASQRKDNGPKRNRCCPRATELQATAGWLAREAKTTRRGWCCLARCRRRGIHCRRCERHAGRIFRGSRQRSFSRPDVFSRRRLLFRFNPEPSSFGDRSGPGGENADTCCRISARARASVSRSVRGRADCMAIFAKSRYRCCGHCDRWRQRRGRTHSRIDRPVARRGTRSFPHARGSFRHGRI